MRPFLWRILRHTVPVLLALVIVALAARDYVEGTGGFKLGVDLVGGTILVYEVDSSKPKRPDYSPEKLAAALKKRVDPADLYNVTIRPVSDTRVEIILPTGGKYQSQAAEKAWLDIVNETRNHFGVPEAKVDAGRGQAEQLIADIEKAVQAKETKGPESGEGDGKAVSTADIRKFVLERFAASEKKFLTGEDVKEIQERIRQVGSLEFRILANDRNDKKALEAAKKFFEDARTDPKLKEELANLALTGTPPPPPVNPDAANPEQKLVFTTDLGNFTYSWVEIGKSERHQLGLDNAAEMDPKKLEELEKKENRTEDEQRALQRAIAWRTAKEHRDKGEAFQVGSILLWSREVRNINLPKDDRDKKFEYFILTRDPEPGKQITGEYLSSVSEGVDQRGQLSVNFRLDGTGANLFRELTSKNKPAGQDGFETRLAIVLDGLIMSAPGIRSTISGDGQISGGFTPVEVERLVNILRSGALPATLKPLPVSENTIGATLGEDTIRAGTMSVGLAFVAVLVFMVIYYRFAGLVACIALLANLVLTVAFMVLVKATFTLPGLAGLVLMLGMAVDANVLIYERIREERDRGASLALAIRNGYDRAFPAIIDTHLTSIFTAVVLYIVGNDQLKGFGISLTSGLVISLWTSLYMTRLVFDIGLANGWIKELRMMRLLSKPNINFMAIRNLMFFVTIALTIGGLVLFGYRVANGGLNIDFVGGTAFTGRLANPEKITDLRRLLSDDAQKQALQVKVEEVPGSNGEVFKITYAGGKWGDVAYPEETRIVRVPRDEQRPQDNLPERISERASQLPDLSVEQIFRSDAPVGQDGSDVFNVRTTERSPELVFAALDRLLGDRLRKVAVKFEVAGDGHSAELHFFEPKEGGVPDEENPATTSPSGVKRLLEQVFNEKGLPDAAKTFTLENKGKPTPDGQTSFMKLTLPSGDKVTQAQLTGVLKAFQEALPKQPVPERLENFDSGFAAETQNRALYAILASWVAILLYLWFRFGNWTFGLAAVLCLIHDLCFTLGAIAASHWIHNYATPVATILQLSDFKLDLPSVAALLTLVGYSVNDTIIVFDRIREVRGKNPQLTYKMINDSVNQTLSRTILTSFITWLVVAVLFVFGGEGVHLFGFVMVVGVIIGTYSSIYVAAPLLITFGEGRGAGQQQEAQETAATAE